MTRRRMTPPTPVQNSYASLEGEQGSYEVEGQGWSAKERTLMARTKQLLERRHSAKVQVEEDLLGPEDVDVDFRRILKEAGDERVRKIFETFSSDGLSDFLVEEWSRWDKYKEHIRKKKVMDAVEDYLENCAQVKVDIEVVESLVKPEKLEVSLKYILKHSTRRDS